jgi:hypothetical protein
MLRARQAAKKSDVGRLPVGPGSAYQEIVLIPHRGFVLGAFRLRNRLILRLIAMLLGNPLKLPFQRINFFL